MNVYLALVGFNLHQFLKKCLAVVGFFWGGVGVLLHKHFPRDREIFSRHLINKTTTPDVSKQHFFLFAALMSSADNIFMLVQSLFGFALQVNYRKKHFDYISIYPIHKKIERKTK